MKTYFTEQEIETLANNLYTYKVSPSIIKFTDAFREDFWRLYLTNLPIKEIFETLGYDAEILGTKRVEGFVYNLRKQMLSDDQRKETQTRTCKIKRPPIDVKYTDMKSADAIRAMEVELTYLRQEVDLLKKLSSLGKHFDKE